MFFLRGVTNIKEPLKFNLLNGKWELLYATSKSILQTQRPKFLTANGEIYQAINLDSLRVQYMETWPYFSRATANSVPLNTKRVPVKFDAFKVLGVILIKACGSGRGRLEITYLDEELREEKYLVIAKYAKENEYIYTNLQKLYLSRNRHFTFQTTSFNRSLPSPMATLSNSTLFRCPSFNPNPKPTTTILLLPPRMLKLCTKASSNDPKNNSLIAEQPPPPTSSEKRSLAAATGELFLGIAARLIKRGNGVLKDLDSQENVRIFGEELAGEKESYFWKRFRRMKEMKEEEIAAVVDDGEVVWEQRLKDVEAERKRKAVTSPGFSFSAAGLLFPYHLGVAKLLIEKGYIKDTTPLAGSSAGAIVCAVVASGASMEEALEATKLLAEDCRSRGTAFRLGAVLRDILEQFLPEDVHIRSNGRVRVAVTQILWRPRGLLVDQFDSREDLINAVITSSFIPGYLAPRPAIMFRNRLCIDGGLTLFMPPTSAARTVRVCAFPAGRLGLENIGISPDCNPENRATPRELFNWALEPAADSVLDNLFELGYMDAAVWAELNPVEDLVREDSPLVENGSVE